MTLAEQLAMEFAHEAGGTIRTLERVPADRLDFRPHPKSMTMQALACHLTEIPWYGLITLQTAEYDFDPTKFVPWRGSTGAEIAARFAASAEEFMGVLRGTRDEHLSAKWRMTVGGVREVFNMPRLPILRGFIFSHMVHHRAQLGLYLRMCDVAVPAIYGPSADEAP